MCSATKQPVTEIDSERCAICGAKEWNPEFKVPFPLHSQTGRAGFALAESVDVPTWTIARCRHCSVRSVYPRPSAEEIDDFYSSQGEVNDFEKEFFVEVSEQKLRSLDDFVESLTALHGKSGRLLEIGCAAGWLLDRARKAGWEVQGLEAAPKFQAIASERLGLPVELGTIGDADPRTLGQFDVIVMFDVLEHLHDPLRDLKKVRELMSDNGHLIVATCAIDSLCAKFYSLAWRQIVVSHTFYWTRQSLKELMRRAGFAVEKFSEPRYWHAVEQEEQQRKARELMKLAARSFLHCTYVPLMNAAPRLQPLVRHLTGGRLDHEALMYKIGDQPVLGDVLLVVAKPV